MKKEWEVESRGKKHKVLYETGRVARVTVNGTETEIRSVTPWLNVFDHHMWVGHEDAHLVAKGKDVKLAVNGVYLDNGEKYEPLKAIPKVLNSLVFFNSVGGALMGGVLCGFAGIVFGTVYAKASLKGGKAGMYAAFMLCTLLQVIWCLWRAR